jgi:ATP-dependent exoDNAse (exonuclease V) beta subunit
LPFSFQGTFPTQRAILEGDGSIELDEERRLCYVAMTRAKTHLIMTWRKEVTTFFEKGFKVNKSERSRFLDSLVSKNQGSEKRRFEKRKQSLTDDNLVSRGYENRSYPSTSSRSQSKIEGDPLALPTPRRSLNSKTTDPQSFTTNTQDLNVVKTMLRNRAIKRDDDKKWSRIQAQMNAKRKKGSNEVDALKASKTNRSSSVPPTVDSTIFFSVGSTVKHPVHGKGTICHPPKEDSMLVRVKFISGLEMNFPVTGSSLTQIFGGQLNS